MTINLSANSTKNILVEENRKKAEKVRQKNNANHQEKFIDRIENTGWIDAIDYAPERNWTHLFAKTPTSKIIDKSFIDKFDNNQDLQNSYKEFDKIHDNDANKFLKSTGNFATAIAIPSLLAGAALIPAANIAGMGYLAGWGINALTGGTIAGVTAGGLKVARNLLFAQKEKETTDGFVKNLKTHAKNNLTDMHKYYNAADKLGNSKLTESELLNKLTDLYNEANAHLQTKHNVNLADVYLSNEDKQTLKDYKNADKIAYTAHELHKNITSIPANLNVVNQLPDGVEGSNDDLGDVVNLKIKALQDIGIVIDIDELSKESDNARLDVTKINQNLNKKYDAVLDNALLVYQGKHSMAEPIVDKIDKLLKHALKAYSEEVTHLAKLKGLKDVPKLTSELVEKIFSRIMLKVALPTNDAKLSRVLKALSDTTAFKVAANLNTYSSDSEHSKEQKALYGDAFLDDVQAMKTREYNTRLKTFHDNYTPVKSSLAQIEALEKAANGDMFSKYKINNKLYDAAAKELSKTSNVPIYRTREWFGIGAPVLKQRYENVPAWRAIPWVTRKKYDLNSSVHSDIASLISKKP